MRYIVLGIFLDTETNGLNAQKNKIIEIAFKIVDVSSGQVLETYQSLVFQEKKEWELSNRESLSVNGFSYEEVQSGKLPAIVAEEIILCFDRFKIKRGEAVFICQNPSFDRAFFCQLIDADKQELLNWPYHWLDLASMFWATNIKQGKLPWDTGFSKDRIAAVYQIGPEKKPHRAINGVDHLLSCYTAVVGFPNQ